MKRIIVSFSLNESLKVPFEVDSSLTNSEIDNLVNSTFSKIPGVKSWEDSE